MIKKDKKGTKMNSKAELKVQDESLDESTVLLTKYEYDLLKKEAEKSQVLYDKYLRLQAEFDNYKKFMDRQKSQYLKFATERILKAILKIYDDLKRAYNGYAGFSHDDGLKLILENLSALLKSEGVEPIKAEGSFNPELHESILIERNPALPDGQITEVLEEGYYLNGKVLRPSKVKVNKEKGVEL